MAEVLRQTEREAGPAAHARWVRVSHWIVAASLVTLAVTGVLILMVHPRLYWGEAGNDLTPAFLELPISRNHKHGGWENRISFFQDSSSPVSASRTFDIFNQNGWGRSLHFLAAWLLVIPGVVYLLAGISSGHFRFHIWPRAAELTPRRFWQEVVDHLHLRIRPATGGPQYRAPSEMRVLHGGLRGFPALHSHRADDVAGGDGGVSIPVERVRWVPVCTHDSLLRVHRSRPVRDRTRRDGRPVRIRAPDARHDFREIA